MRGALFAFSFLAASCVSIAQTPAPTQAAPPANGAAPAPAKAAPTTQATSPALAPAPGPAKYVGSDTCKGCHQEVYDTLAATPHFALEAHGHWAKQACESCHGPGSKHAESMSPADIRNPGKLRVQQASAICLDCHRNQQTHAGTGRIIEAHAQGEVGCLSCHAIHSKTAKLIRTKPAEVNAQCAECHVSQWAAFQRPYHHRLPEGAMSCVDCHNPHGTPQRATMNVAFGNDKGCFRCHANLRGPFVYEHAPVRLEGCATCHEPHGSANPRMLIRHEQRYVCLECHSNLNFAASRTSNLGGVPPSFHDLRSPVYQNCTVCHVKIHGSDVHPDFLR